MVVVMIFIGGDGGGDGSGGGGNDGGDSPLPDLPTGQALIAQSHRFVPQNAVLLRVLSSQTTCSANDKRSTRL